jgi:adenine nucleotide transporter 17
VVGCIGKYAGVADVVRRVYREEGMAGFYRGLDSKIVQSVLTAAFLLMAQEKLARAFFVFLLFFKRRVFAHSASNKCLRP